MPDDQRRLFLTIAICLGIMLVWSWLFAPAPLPTQPGFVPGPGKAGSPAAAGAQDRQGAGAAGPGAPGPAPDGAAPLAVADAPEVELVRESQGRYRAVFTSRGARLKSFVLLEPRYVVRHEDKPPSPVDMVPAKGADRWPLELLVADGAAALPGDAPYRVEAEGPDRIHFVALRPDALRVDKLFVLHADRYVLDLEVRLTNLGAAEVELKPSLHTTSYQDLSQMGGGLLSGLPNLKEAIDAVGGEVERTQVNELPAAFEDRVGVVSFAGWDDRYFLFAMRPRDVETAQVAHKGLGDGVFETALTLPALRLAPGGTETRRFSIYIGPKELETLEAEGDLLAESVDFWVVAFIARPMLWLMKVFHGWVHNWGLAIILLTIVVKLLLLPLTNKSFQSMKEMQRLKPKIDKLREKFVADKERLNQEMLALYRTHKVNPLAGCLPMILQMPVWIALYRTIWSSVELYQAEFLWLKDLTAEDPTYVLPILLGVLTFVQQKMQPVQMDPVQQKMMLWIMPIMFTAFMLFLPSGLVVYIFANSLLTIAQQWYIKRGDTT